MLHYLLRRTLRAAVLIGLNGHLALVVIEHSLTISTLLIHELTGVIDSMNREALIHLIHGHVATLTAMLPALIITYELASGIELA